MKYSRITQLLDTDIVQPGKQDLESIFGPWTKKPSLMLRRCVVQQFWTQTPIAADTAASVILCRRKLVPGRDRAHEGLGSVLLPSDFPQPFVSESLPLCHGLGHLLRVNLPRHADIPMHTCGVRLGGVERDVRSTYVCRCQCSGLHGGRLRHSTRRCDSCSAITAPRQTSGVMAIQGGSHGHVLSRDLYHHHKLHPATLDCTLCSIFESDVGRYRSHNLE